jgi:hypothetical protein
LKEQKKALLAITEDCDDVPKLEKLEGVISLINEIQDYAVDVLGMDENEVFDLHPEDDCEKDDNGNCKYCGQKCWEGEMCDEQQAGGFNNVPEEKPVSTRYKVWVEIERIETDKEGNETYHDEDFPVGIAYEDNIEDAVELQKIINDQYGRLE